MVKGTRVAALLVSEIWELRSTLFYISNATNRNGRLDNVRVIEDVSVFWLGEIRNTEQANNFQAIIQNLTWRSCRLPSQPHFSRSSRWRRRMRIQRTLGTFHPKLATSSEMLIVWDHLGVREENISKLTLAVSPSFTSWEVITALFDSKAAKNNIILFHSIMRRAK